jgi:hypothetical protein
MVTSFSVSAFHHLIANFPYRPSTRKFQQQQPMRAQNPAENGALVSIVDDQAHDISYWMALGQRFGVAVSQGVPIAQYFFCIGCRPLLFCLSMVNGFVPGTNS